MAESIRFDFLSTGAEKLARDFKNTGDNAAAAARGARVLQEIIGKLGDREDRTAAQSRILASALRETGREEDRAASKALRAEIAIKRLDEAVQKEERDALKAAAANRTLGNAFDTLAEKAGGPNLKGALLALSPALIPVAAGLAPAIGAIGVSFGAAALGAGLFAKAASSVLSGASEDLKKLQTLEQKVNTARQKAATAQTAAQKKAAEQQVKIAEQQVAALKGTWAKGYLEMLNTLDTFKSRWKTISQQITVPALTAGIRALSDAIGFLKPALQPVADLFTSWGKSIDRYFTSGRGSAEMNRLAAAFGRFSADQLSSIGVFVSDIARGVANLGKAMGLNAGNFGQFSVYMLQWGGAFRRWSESAAARRDVNRFLEYVRANGPVVGELLRNLGGVLKAFAPGLSSAGQLELRLVTDFLGFLARTPQWIAKPLIDTAGALFLLQKIGVLKVGIKIVGAAVKWLTGGVINIGSGAATAAEIRAAFTSGGAAAAAEIRAAMAGGGAVSGAGGAAGAAAAKGGLGGLLSGLAAQARGPAVAAAAAAIAGGLVLKVREDIKSGFTGIVRDIPHWFNFGTLGFIAQSAQGWADLIVSKIRHSLLSWEDGVRHFIAGSFDQTRHDTAAIWGGIINYLSGSWHKLGGTASSAFGAVARAVSSWWSNIRGGAALWWRNIAATVSNWQGNIRSGTARWLSSVAGTVSGWWSRIRAGAALWWSNIWQSVVSRTITGVQSVGRWVGTLPGAIRSRFAGAGSWLYGSGKNVISGLWSGMKAIWSSVTKFVSSIAGWIKLHKGPLSLDSNLLVGAGKAIMSGFHVGLKDGFGHVMSFVSGVADTVGGLISKGTSALGSFFGLGGAGNVSGGVANWLTMALRFTGKPLSWLPWLKLLVSRESGGSPTVVNPISVLGQHATGLMQMLPSTFLAYSGGMPLSMITNPVANAEAAIRYISARYGSPANIPGLLSGSYRGYSSGTGGAAPGWAWVGERGPELVRFHGGEHVIPSGPSHGIAAATGAGFPGYASGTALKNQVRQMIRNRIVPAPDARDMLADLNSMPRADVQALIRHLRTYETRYSHITHQGAAYLRAWQTRRGPGAHGPVVLDEQVARISRKHSASAALAAARGLSAGQHRFWVSAAAAQKRHLDSLTSERSAVVRWYNQVGADQAQLARQVSAAGTLPQLRHAAATWKAQIARDKATRTALSHMVGHSDAYLAAHKPPPPPPPAPGSIPHTGAYTDRTADMIAALFTAAAGLNRVVTLDSGGWLPAGLSLAYNGTGRPEQLVRPSGGSSGGGNTYVINAPHYVGSHGDLVRALDDLRRQGRLPK